MRIIQTLVIVILVVLIIQTILYVFTRSDSTSIPKLKADTLSKDAESKPIVLVLSLADFHQEVTKVGKAIKWLDENERYPKDNPVLSDKIRRFYAERIVLECHRRGIDPLLFTSLIWIESRFIYNARSSAGAIGLCQIMPQWIYNKNRMLSRADIVIGGNVEVEDLFDPIMNIYLGTEIFYYYLVKNDMVIWKSLAQYNGSSGRKTYSDKVLRVYTKLKEISSE